MNKKSSTTTTTTTTTTTHFTSPSHVSTYAALLHKKKGGGGSRYRHKKKRGLEWKMEPLKKGKKKQIRFLTSSGGDDKDDTCACFRACVSLGANGS